MRLKIRRLGKCSFIFLALLILLVILNSNPFGLFRNPTKHAVFPKAFRHGIVPEIYTVFPKIGNQPPILDKNQIQKADDFKEDPNKNVQYDRKQGFLNVDPMLHGNDDGTAKMGTRKDAAGADNDSKLLPEMYDWTTLRHQYFMGENVPDDMFALHPPRYLSDYKNPCFYLTHPEANTVTGGGNVTAPQLKCLPYFHLIGVDKCGTTDLWTRVAKHPHVVPNSGVLGKETHWWSWRRFGFDIWIRNAPIRHFDWYLSNFDQAARRIRDSPETVGGVPYHPMVTGEGSPTVFWDFTGWDLIPQNSGRTAEFALVTPFCIRHLTPDVKLIIMLRNPVERLFSEYLFLDRFKSHHNISADLFHQDVVQSIAMYSDCLRQSSMQTCLYNKTLHMALPVRIMVGMYSAWLPQWFAAFPRHQILILRNEDYAQDLPTHMARVFNFLGLRPLNETEMQKVLFERRVFQRSARERGVGEMLPITRKILTVFFQPFNKQLANILGDPRYLWQ